MAKAKICGITRASDLSAACDAGAALVGFVFYPASPRYLSPERAEALLEENAKKIATVAVTVDADDDMLEDIALRVSPSYFQLHGDESPERVADIKRRFPSIKVMKAIRVRTADDVATAHRYEKMVDMIAFDARAPSSSLPGGNGLRFDWKILQGRVPTLPWMLAGGLHAGNVTEAIRLTGAPFVDVSSGVESSPGIKNAVLIKEFVRCAS
ncbi:MAG: phosphoribosylanthranilate isomerase [Rickettsiales bacterium]